MPVQKEALEKVRTAKMTGENFATVIGTLATSLELTGAAETHLTLDYQHDDMEVKPGDMIPVITIGLRQATIPTHLADIKKEDEPQQAE